MASRWRSLSRPALSLLHSASRNANANATGARSLPSNLLPRRSSHPSSRVGRRLGCHHHSLQTMLPLHSVVSSARLTSRVGVDSRVASRSLYQGTICSSIPGV